MLTRVAVVGPEIYIRGSGALLRIIRLASIFYREKLEIKAEHYDYSRRGRYHCYWRRIMRVSICFLAVWSVSLIVLSCVVAGRLANLDHNLQVMLIEAGESNLNNPWVYRPGIYPRNMKLDSKTASFYYSRPSEWLGGRRAVVPCAHILGGGSSINFMVSEATTCKACAQC